MLFFHFSVFSFPRLSGPNKVPDYIQANTTKRWTVNIYKLKYLLASRGQNHEKLCVNIHTHISINTTNKTSGSV